MYYIGMEINIPTTLKEIPLSQMAKWEQSDKTENDLVSIFCGVENPELISLKDYKELISLVGETLNQEPKFYKTFNYKGIDFGFIPNLDIMPTNEYIDLEEFSKNPNEWYKAMSVMYRPIIKRKRNWFKRSNHDLYDILDYKGINDIFIDAPCEYYLGAMLFFWNLKTDLLNAMLNYSSKVEKALMKKQVSTQNGDGMLA